MAVTDFGANGYELIGECAPSGSTFGVAATSKISFYGTTPAVQPTGIGTKDTTAPATTGIYGFTSTQANQIMSAINGLRTLGLIGA